MAQGDLYRDGTEWYAYEHLLEVQERAEKAFDQLMEQMARVEGVTEELKAMDQMEWVRRMNNVRMRAEDIVREQIIYRV